MFIKVDDLESDSTALLLHHLIANAVQPSPIQNDYFRNELEVSEKQFNVNKLSKRQADGKGMIVRFLLWEKSIG